MALYPQSFIEDVRTQADIVAVVQDTVALRKAGVTYKGLCPFHNEKTPSFTVNRDRGFFYCFGCQVGGDVIKFVELRDKAGFGEAVRTLAQRFGVPVPETRESRDPDGDAEREALLKVHEVAADYFREMLADSTGAGARQQLEARGIDAGTVERLGLGFAPLYREGLKTRLLKAGYDLPLVIKSGVVLQRDRPQKSSPSSGLGASAAAWRGGWRAWGTRSSAWTSTWPGCRRSPTTSLRQSPWMRPLKMRSRRSTSPPSAP